jgi:hypothetical protein
MSNLDLGLGRSRAMVMVGAIAVACLVLVNLPAMAKDIPGFEARAGLDLTLAAARSWAPDAALVYVENDEDLAADGAAGRWGYLYYSAAMQKARGYSVREGRIVVAENLEMAFEAPPIASQWIDSGAAIHAAEESVGRTFRKDHEARLSAMLLTRGALSDGDPNLTTWTLVYSSPNVPSLFVVVDATDGHVRRTWRG